MGGFRSSARVALGLADSEFGPFGPGSGTGQVTDLKYPLRSSEPSRHTESELLRATMHTRLVLGRGKLKRNGRGREHFCTV